MIQLDSFKNKVNSWFDVNFSQWNFLVDLLTLKGQSWKNELFRVMIILFLFRRYYQSYIKQSSRKQQNQLCQNHGPIPDHQIQRNSRTSKQRSHHQSQHGRIPFFERIGQTFCSLFRFGCFEKSRSSDCVASWRNFIGLQSIGKSRGSYRSTAQFVIFGDSNWIQ